jgi:hypothetical protein
VVALRVVAETLALGALVTSWRPDAPIVDDAVLFRYSVPV